MAAPAYRMNSYERRPVFPLPPVRRVKLNGDAGVPRAGSRLILVVDDEPNIVEFLTMLLEDEGYRVVPAFDGEQALALLEQAHPELVISDVMMPGLDGPDFLDIARRRLSAGCPRVIFMSAVSHEPLLAGTSFIQKPFDIDDLLLLISMELEQPRAIHSTAGDAS